MRVPWLLLLSVFLFGCATGSGTLFESEARAASSGRRSESSQDDDEPDTPDDVRPGLMIRTSPVGAVVFVNGRRQGRSPMRLELPSGRYQIYTERDGYRPAQVIVSYTAGTRQEVSLELQEITGRLRIDVQPREARVTTGFRQLQTGTTQELRVGTYPLNISAFGYEPVEQTVVVQENRTSTLSITLKPAEFRVRSVSPRTTHFSPDDPGRLGSGSVGVFVSAAGRGEYHVTDASGLKVAGPVPVFFSQASTTLAWDGRDQSGRPVPDGRYRFVLTAEDGTRETITLTADSSISRRLRPVFGSAAGTLFSPLPATFPNGTNQIALTGFAHGSGGMFTAPMLASFRLGVGHRQEIVFAAGGILRGPEDLAAGSGGHLSTSWSLPLYHTPGASGSLVLRATLSEINEIDLFENATGAGVAVPIATHIGPLTLVVTPELSVAPADTVVAAPEAGFGSTIPVFGYGRVAAVLDLGATSIAASGAVRMRPIGAPPGPDWPASAGLELHQTFPNEQFSLSALGTLRWHPTEGWYGSTGLGFQALWW
ncbi:MAG: PEGA domain-containing protein [Spirochaetaceae bacterium]|nr:MAG: PEGA domain-containing protein [Spirochaetaceae bacterium]